MAYIYLITNKINGKKYVGKTNFSIEKRWSEHIRDSRKERNEKRPLYNALNKYGAENFTIEELEEVSVEEAAKAEEQWIQKYDSYKNGYNATLGGDGATYLDHQGIIDLAVNSQLSRSEVAAEMGCSEDSVYCILKANDVEVDWYKRMSTNKGKAVAMLDIETGEVLQEFNSQLQAAQYLIDNGYSKTKSATSLSTKIADVIKGRRKSSHGFKWKSI